MAITFFIQSKKAPAPIYVRIREGVEIDAKAKTGFKVNHENFSKGKVKLFKKPSGADASVKKEIQEKNDPLIKLQEDLDSLRIHLTNLLNNRKEYEEINSKWLKSVINPDKEVDSVPSNLVEYFDYYIDFKRSSLESSTIKKLKVFRSRMGDFQKDYGIVYIQDVNKKLSIAIQKWCDKNGYAHNTKVKTLKVIKTVCNHAKENGVIAHPELDLITKGLKYKKVEHIHLDFDEIQKIIDSDLEDEKLDIARDWLVISCYTAQRVSDFLRFSKDSIVEMDGEKFLDIRQKKTDEPIYIFLSDEVVDILNKRGGEFPPVFSENTESNKTIYNRLIKDVCRLANIKNTVTANLRNPLTNRYEEKEVPKYKAVSTHIGRRSYATNYYGKINTALLIAATGHASEEQFLRYVGKKGTQNALSLAKEMRKLAVKEGRKPHLKLIKNVSG
ncbi:hypothetical protein D1816_23005 [Aquimarina sp. AD10]|uniref:phage integrase SAM-like domain-containing protein n=1 Tax=Aquimarina sp. AD10 TaxID=1714849 RepID=UPI000E48BDED|nr:phage integrase SAM-like domain-containing protein [Aquimarina sp. AD10]AXT63093.1 hypothetical protein D1816_23005 [Aquimarina sp. AD10]RKM98691.1 hypothetical protein D7033_12200 [Aquimarina sp. AD10]